MTFCVALKTADGLVALADTRIVKGSEWLTRSKLSTLQHRGESFFIMTSGLRSIRDKLLVHTAERLEADEGEFSRLHQIATLFGQRLQAIRQEDGDALQQSNLSFNLHAIIGGRLQGDTEPCLYFLYPEGNWIEASPDSPYFMIGRTYYGKPILDRLMRDDVSLDRACALAMLAFDATQTSVTDVGFPIDMLTVPACGSEAREQRFEQADLQSATDSWQAHLSDAIEELPMDWAAPLLAPD